MKKKSEIPALNPELRSDIVYPRENGVPTGLQQGLAGSEILRVSKMSFAISR